MKNNLIFYTVTALLAIGCNQNQKTTAVKINTYDQTILNQNGMDNQDYSTTIFVKQSPKITFDAIKNFRAWWSEEIEGETDQLNKVFFYHYKDIHLCKIKLIEVIVNKKLVYQVIDNQFNFTKDKSEWINTKLIFDISLENEKTKVKFTHLGLVPEYECYKICEDAWGNYINNSLYNLITTGEGQPNPKDKDGFNAEIVEKWKLKG